MRGYSLKEVDSFLDQIIGDYEQFNELIRNYEHEKEENLKDFPSFSDPKHTVYFKFPWFYQF